MFERIFMVVLSVWVMVLVGLIFGIGLVIGLDELLISKGILTVIDLINNLGGLGEKLINKAIVMILLFNNKLEIPQINNSNFLKSCGINLFDKKKTNQTTPITSYGVSTGGCIGGGDTREGYLISWISEFEDEVFELPTGGACNMKKGKNLISFGKKEQCLALGLELRLRFGILNYKIFRVFPTNEIEYLHPNDGEFPEWPTLGRSFCIKTLS